MKNNIIIALIAAVFGVGVGYLLFGKQTAQIHEHSSMSEGQTVESSQIWTCSMHPQIRQPEPGDCAICGMDLIPLEEGGSDNPLVLEMSEAAVKLANIQTTTIGQTGSSSAKELRLTGKVQADERQAASQVTHVSGRIEKLFVTFTGEQVAKGQKIATIFSPELITAQRELIEAAKLKDLNPQLLEAARNKLRFLKIGEQTIQQIEDTEKIQENFTVYADESGVVTQRRVSVGDYIESGGVLFDLMNLHKVWVLFDAYEENLATISLGDRIEFTTPAIPNKTFKTRVTFIDPMLDASTRTVSIRAEVNNQGGLLKPEMLVTGILENKTKNKTTLTVPKSAVLWTGKRSIIYVKLPDTDIPSFEFKEVELGESLGNSYQILSGLNAGDEVVTYGSFTIDAAAQLNNQASMMNRQVTIEEEEAVVEEVPDFRAVIPANFQEKLADLTTKYMLVKDALVDTDANTASEAAQAFQENLLKIQVVLNNLEAQDYWQEKYTALNAHSKKIATSENVEKQRKQFEFLSIAMINLIEAFGTGGKEIYVQYCPMAFKNAGADWLALEEDIQNPYFGDKMMRCGIVKREIE